jgi:enamine deaminase RidA (YjgF/YER057c/UK114 family)
MHLKEATGRTPEERIASLGLTIPPAALGVADYESWVIANGILYTSGQLPWRDGKLGYTGKIGGALTAAEGYVSCQLSTLNAIAQLKAALGSLEKVERIIRVEGVLNVAPGFIDYPEATGCRCSRDWIALPQRRWRAAAFRPRRPSPTAGDL